MQRIVVGVLMLFICEEASSLPLQAGEPVDINRATVTELMRAPGMTASWARRIVRFRPYRTKLDLVDQGVVSQDVYQRIREGVVAHRVEGLVVRGKKRDSSGKDTR
jgi:predicted DNA-binding helix-hairpin-helix protein